VSGRAWRPAAQRPCEQRSHGRRRPGPAAWQRAGAGAPGPSPRARPAQGLPLGSGLGSSAASAAAAALAVNALFGAPLAKAALVPAGLASEAAVSGFHADNIAPALLGGFIMVRRGPPRLVAAPPPHEDGALRAHRGRARSASRRALRKLCSAQSAWQRAFWGRVCVHASAGSPVGAQVMPIVSDL